MRRMRIEWVIEVTVVVGSQHKPSETSVCYSYSPRPQAQGLDALNGIRSPTIT